jgi:hypothetical protein
MKGQLLNILLNLELTKKSIFYLGVNFCRDPQGKNRVKQESLKKAQRGKIENVAGSV